MRLCVKGVTLESRILSFAVGDTRRLVIATLIQAFRRATKGFEKSADAENCSEIEMFSGDVIPSHLSRVAGRELWNSALKLSGSPFA